MGIGVDIIENKRFAKFKITPDHLNSLYTKSELSFLQSKKYEEKYFAQLFAIKEAVSKTLGYGFSRGVSPLDIEVEIITNSPKITLHGRAKEVFIEKGYSSIDVSVTSNDISLAICIIK